MSHQASFLFSKLSQAYDRQGLPHALLITSQSKASQENLATQLCSYISGSAIQAESDREQANQGGLLDDLGWDEPIDLSLSEEPELTQAEIGGYADEAEVDFIQNSEFVRVIAPTSKSRKIAIGFIRELEQFFSQKTAANQAKIAIIKDADRMTIEAQNAFLKTLEEPPNGCYLILLTSELHQLLPTTRSRCLTLSVSDQAQPQIQDWQLLLIPFLEETLKEGFADEVQAIIAQRYFQKLLADRKALILEEQESQFKSDTKKYSDATYKTWIKEEKIKLESLIESLYIEERSQLIQLCQYWLGELILQYSGQEPSTYQIVAKNDSKISNTNPLQTHQNYQDTLTNITLESLLSRYQFFEELENNLKTNAQETLALESGFLKALA